MRIKKSTCLSISLVLLCPFTVIGCEPQEKAQPFAFSTQQAKTGQAPSKQKRFLPPPLPSEKPLLHNPITRVANSYPIHNDISDTKLIEIINLLETSPEEISRMILQNLIPDIEKSLLRCSGTLVQSIKESSDSSSIAFSPSASLFALGSYNNTIKIRNIHTGKLIHTLTGHKDSILSVIFNPDGSLSGHKESIVSVAFNPDGSLLASGSYDKTIKMWNPHTGKLIDTLTGHRGTIESVAFNANGSLLASGSYDDTIKIWNPHTRKLIHTLTGHKSTVQSVAFHPDGSMLASGSLDYTIKIWDPYTGQLIDTLNTRHMVSSLAFNPSGSLLASGLSKGTILIWDLHTGQLTYIPTGHRGPIHSVDFDRSGDLLAAGFEGRAIEIWDTNTWKLIHTLSERDRWISSVAFNPDGSLFAWGPWDGITLWRVSTPERLTKLLSRLNSYQLFLLYVLHRNLENLPLTHGVNLQQIEKKLQRKYGTTPSPEFLELRKIYLEMKKEFPQFVNLWVKPCFRVIDGYFS